MSTVAVVGLGRMGGGMLATLARAGRETLGFDVSAQARDVVRAAGGRLVDRLDDVWSAETIVLSLPRPEHVEAVLAGPGGLLGSGAGGRLVVDTSTSLPSVTRRLASALAEAGHALVDAPVSGGPAGAASGTLSIMVGGEAEAVARARSVLDVLGQRIALVGGPGTGHVAKLVNNVLVAGHLIAAGEAMRLGLAAGADLAPLLEVVNGASGRSAVTEINYPRWIASGTFDSGFSMGLMRKDVDLALDLAAEEGLDLPMLAFIRERWRILTEAQGAEADFNRATAGVTR